MVQFTLSVKADLENVTNLHPDASIDWKIKFKCSHCNEVKESFVDVNGQEQLENPHGRGTTNLIMKCKFCKRDMTVDVVSTKACRALTPEDNGKFVPVIVFDCRGVVPVEFQPANGWTCQGVKSEKEFEVELHEDWADYDDKANESVGIYNVGYQIE